MATNPVKFYTPEEYLSLERSSEHKSEYLNGQIFAMGGASPQHILIITNVVTQLNIQLRNRPCTVYSTDLRVRVSPTGLYTYPDIVVACEELVFADDQNDTLVNPTLIIEVLSPSTKDYDRGEKFEHYRSLRSLKEYLLIAQDKCHVEQFIKQDNGLWLLSETNKTDDVIKLSSISCELSLTETYAKVKF
ncbi:MAG TPA: Uma2 family endonuclease [Blastocatellia bacterium]|nr:Uma2 family endonuclease [Blastocatellia bacterium]